MSSTLSLSTFLSIVGFRPSLYLSKPGLQLALITEGTPALVPFSIMGITIQLGAVMSCAEVLACDTALSSDQCQTTGYQEILVVSVSNWGKNKKVA